MTLTEELQDVKSPKLALLSEMLGIWPFCNIHKDHDEQDKWYCIKCGEVTTNSGRKCPYPDPLPTDPKSMAWYSWQVQEKMLEMHLYNNWKWVLDGDPADWIEAGLTVFQESKA